MPRTTTGAALLAAALCALPAWGQAAVPSAEKNAAVPAAAPLAGPALELGLQAQAAFTRAESFALKGQAAGAVAVRGELPLLPWAALGLGLDGHWTLGSGLEGGWQYSGHLGAGLRAYGRLRFSLGPTEGGRSLHLGAATGASFNYDRYAFTLLRFFYPGWFLEPQVELQLRPGGRSGLALSLPVDVYFRKDLDLSAAVGLGASWRLYRRSRP